MRSLCLGRGSRGAGNAGGVCASHSRHPVPAARLRSREVAELATQLGMPVQMAKWSEADEIPVPSIVNWKLGHYAAIVSKDLTGKYRVKDRTFGLDNSVSEEAIRAEASGYFLVPSKELPPGFRVVSASEGSKVFGRGQVVTVQDNQVTTGDHQVPPKEPGCGMADYTIHTMMVSLHLEDAPLAYDPPFGPKVALRVSCNERETVQPANLNYTNFGRQMDAQLEWLDKD